MASYATNQFKNGLKVLLDGDPAVMVDNQTVKPGKGQAFNRVKFKNLKTGKTLEKTFKSGESIPAADVVEIEADYLYNDGEFYNFMEPENFEQHSISKQSLGDTKKWLKENDSCIITLFNGYPIMVIPPNFVNLFITETDPGLKGDTAGTGGKPAILETGAVVRVPLFVKIGETIRVDTRTSEYVSRVKV